MHRIMLSLLILTLAACHYEPTPCCKHAEAGLSGDPPPEGDCGASGFQACDGTDDEANMPQQQTYSAKGLYTFPNPLSEVPDGAFSRADDVVIRREGFVETRRGFKTATGAFGSSGDRLASLADFAGTLVGQTSADALVRYNGSSAWTAYSGTYPEPAAQRLRFLQMAKSLYFTTSTGVKRLDSASGTPKAAGVPQAVGGTVALKASGAHATGTVTLAGGTGNPTITIGGTAVGPVTFVTSDTLTAAACVTAINANTTVAALVHATSAGAVITLRAVNGGTGGNAITLTASRSAGAATASGATLTGGTNTTGFLSAGSQTAYRFVWGTRTTTDRIILGAPSGRMSLTNLATETDTDVTVTAPIPSWVTADYFLQVYRSDTSGGEDIPASDDMALAYEAYPTASELAAHSLTFTDITPDELKGAALYSSPNAGVPGSEKFQPPVCVDLAEYKQRMWCAATVQRQRFQLTLLSVEALGGDQGVILTSGATVETYRSDTAGENPATKTFLLAISGTASQNIAATAQSLVRVINAASAFATAHYVSGEYDSPGQILIETSNLGASAFTVAATGPTTPWLPALSGSADAIVMSRTSNVVQVTTEYPHGFAVGQTVNLSTSSDPTAFPTGVKTVTVVVSEVTFKYAESGSDVSPDVRPYHFETTTPAPQSDPTDAANGLAYSEFSEPDAVPLPNYMSAGSANYRILRLIPLGDTLFIFKEDGVWVLTGDSPETFSLRPFSNPAKLLAPDSVVVLGNSIYALTDQGVMQFSESSAQVISRPIEGDLLPLYSGNATMQATLKAVAFGVAYETEREYHLFLPSQSSDTYATQEYVYNYATRTWVRWTKPATCGYVLPGADVEYLGKATANAALVERKTRTVADYQDEDATAITSAVDWQVRTGGDPSAYKQWQKVTVMCEQGGPMSVTLSLGTELSATRTSGSMPMDGLPYIQSYVPVEQARSQTLTVGVSGGQAQKKLALTGLSVDFIPSSTKLR